MTNLAFLCRSWVGDSSGFTTFNSIICSRLIIDRSNPTKWPLLKATISNEFSSMKMFVFLFKPPLICSWGPSVGYGYGLVPVKRHSITRIPVNPDDYCHYVSLSHRPFTRYAQLRVAHAPGMPGTLSPPPRVSDPDMHPGTCVTHVPGCMSGSLTRGFHWCLWRGKRSRHSRCTTRNSTYLVRCP